MSASDKSAGPTTTDDDLREKDDGPAPGDDASGQPRPKVQSPRVGYKGPAKRARSDAPPRPPPSADVGYAGPAKPRDAASGVAPRARNANAKSPSKGRAGTATPADVARKARPASATAKSPSRGKPTPAAAGNRSPDAATTKPATAAGKKAAATPAKQRPSGGAKKARSPTKKPPVRRAKSPTGSKAQPVRSPPEATPKAPTTSDAEPQLNEEPTAAKTKHAEEPTAVESGPTASGPGHSDKAAVVEPEPTDEPAAVEPASTEEPIATVPEPTEEAAVLGDLGEKTYPSSGDAARADPESDVADEPVEQPVVGDAGIAHRLLNRRPSSRSATRRTRRSLGQRPAIDRRVVSPERRAELAVTAAAIAARDAAAPRATAPPGDGMRIRLVALGVIALLVGAVLAVFLSRAPTSALSKADARFMSGQLLTADRRVRSQLAELSLDRVQLARSRTRGALATTRSLTVEMRAKNGDAADRVRRALGSERDWLDAVGSVLANPRSPLREQLISRDRELLAALAALPGDRVANRDASTTLVAYAMSRDRVGATAG